MFQGVYLDRHYVIDKLRVVAARGNEGFATVMNHCSATQNIRIEGSINIKLYKKLRRFYSTLSSYLWFGRVEQHVERRSMHCIAFSSL
jgi:hypothetical protein